MSYILGYHVFHAPIRNEETLSLRLDGWVVRLRPGHPPTPQVFVDPFPYTWIAPSAPSAPALLYTPWSFHQDFRTP
jgi:hypothetical protein